jgi:hypothetical protein
MRLGTPPDRVDAVAAGVGHVATSLGGFVASSSVTSRRGATIQLRVPGARLDDAVARLSDLARVRDLQRSTLDITARAVSVRTRLADARAERRGLLRQLAHAPTPNAADRIRTRLRAVSREIERARAALRRVRDRASYADVDVDVTAERRPAPAGAGGSWTPGDALHDAVRVLEVTAGVLLVALAVLLPLGLLGGAAWVAARRLAQRRREHALDLA